MLSQRQIPLLFFFSSFRLASISRTYRSGYYVSDTSSYIVQKVIITIIWPRIDFPLKQNQMNILTTLHSIHYPVESPNRLLTILFYLCKHLKRRLLFQGFTVGIQAATLSKEYNHISSVFILILDNTINYLIDKIKVKELQQILLTVMLFDIH